MTITGDAHASRMPDGVSLRRLGTWTLLVLCGLLCVAPSCADAGERYALLVTGASGGEAYAKK